MKVYGGQKGPIIIGLYHIKTATIHCLSPTFTQTLKPALLVEGWPKRPKKPHNNWTISYKNGHFLLPTTHFHPKTQACFALSPQYKVGSSVVYYVLGAVATLRFFLKEA